MPPSSTLPPTPATLLGTRPALASATDTARKAPGRKAEAMPEPKPGSATLDQILNEVRGVRETQRLTLEGLEGLRRALAKHAGADGTAPGLAPTAPVPGFDEEGAAALSPIRARQRKSVLLVDDDPQTREAAVAELLHSDVPVRAFDDGNAALAAIAEEKPDVIALEIGLAGDMGGKDLVNMIKATMEWVDIPVILWTRVAVASHREARQIHGADEVVQKSSGPAALAARVITVFRRA
jgi:CheY-like chemotaxis protein